MTENENSNGLQTIISQALETLNAKYGKTFNVDKVNLAELQRMTGISRSRLRHLQKNHFVVQPHGRIGLHARVTVLSGFEGVLDSLLRKGVKNSQVCFEKLREIGYTGSLTQVKVYIRQHQNLIPAKRNIIASHGQRSLRYRTSPGEAYQMDWGFVNAAMLNGRN